MSKKSDKKVENAFTEEDGKDAKLHKKQKTSFATKEDLGEQQQEQQPQPTQLDVSLYMAKRLNDINDKLGILIEQGQRNVYLQPQLEKKSEEKQDVKKDASPLTLENTVPTPQTQEPAMAKLEDIKMMFPEDLENLLTFEEKEDYIIIAPRQFLGSENFTKIASIIRAIGGDYVSAGKESHFRCPKNAKIAKPAPAPQETAKATGNVLATLKQKLAEYIEAGDVAIDETSSATMFIVNILQYLGKPKFTEIARIVKPLGGRYVSQGKASHFDVPKNS